MWIALKRDWNSKTLRVVQGGARPPIFWRIVQFWLLFSEAVRQALATARMNAEHRISWVRCGKDGRRLSVWPAARHRLRHRP